jgi:ferredoxin
MKLRRLPFTRSSTLSFIKEGYRLRRYSLFDFLHGYIYARWPYFYISVGTGEHRLAPFLARLISLLDRWLFSGKSESSLHVGEKGKTFADTYHGKVMTLDSATRLITINQEICLTDLEHVIPYTCARDIILKNPNHIVVLECPCRKARNLPCLPLDVCLIVGEPFASFISDHHPRRSRWISAQEAVEILRSEHERGHVHHAFFKDAMLDRFYAICNCCSCCCGAIQAHRNGTPMLASSGYICEVDEEMCIGCGDCQEVCQFSALDWMDGKNRVHAEKCMGCGVCLSRCMQGALSLRPDELRGMPLDILELLTP